MSYVFQPIVMLHQGHCLFSLAWLQAETMTASLGVHAGSACRTKMHGCYKQFLDVQLCVCNVQGLRSAAVLLPEPGKPCACKLHTFLSYGTSEDRVLCGPKRTLSEKRHYQHIAWSSLQVSALCRQAVIFEKRSLLYLRTQSPTVNDYEYVHAATE